MPNWCYSNVTFYSKNPNPVNNFHNVLTSILENLDKVKKSCDDYWFSYITPSLYPDLVDSEGGVEGLELRGWIDEVSDVFKGGDVYSFTMKTTSAWAPKFKWFINYLDEHKYNLDMDYITDEEGGAFFLKCNNGGFYPDKYQVDISVDNEFNTDYYEDGDEDCIIDSVCKFADLPCEDISTLAELEAAFNAKYGSEETDDCLIINEYTYEDIRNFD